MIAERQTTTKRRARKVSTKVPGVAIASDMSADGATRPGTPKTSATAAPAQSVDRRRKKSRTIWEPGSFKRCPCAIRDDPKAVQAWVCGVPLDLILAKISPETPAKPAGRSKTPAKGSKAVSGRVRGSAGGSGGKVDARSTPETSIVAARAPADTSAGTDVASVPPLQGSAGTPVSSTQARATVKPGTTPRKRSAAATRSTFGEQFRAWAGSVPIASTPQPSTMDPAAGDDASERSAGAAGGRKSLVAPRDSSARLAKADSEREEKQISMRYEYIRQLVDACDARGAKHHKALDDLVTFQAQMCRSVESIEARIAALESLGGRGATRGR